MALTVEGSLPYQVQCALSYPLVKKCWELKKLFMECNYRDAHAVFPVIVESIFGFGTRQGWGLLHVYRHQHPREFNSVRQFVSPDGPLLELAYKLMNDVHLRYEFPVSCLPTPVLRSLEVDIIPPFYVGKLQTNTPGRLASALGLNPFEFFLFHLSYFMIRSQNHRTMPDWNEVGDPVHAFVVEDYLHYFLPLNGAYPPPPVHSVPMPTKFNSPSQFTSSNDRTTSGSSGGGSHLTSIFGGGLDSRPSRNNLFKQASLMITRQNSTGGDLSRDSPPVELWRSEVFAQVLIEFWLNHYGFETQRSFNASDKSRGLDLSRSPNLDRTWASSNDMSFQPNTSNISFSEPFFPSTYHVRLVRLCVKHSHYFANSARPNSSDKFDAFKRALIPQLLRKKLYTFVRHLFDHWPLDASFRLVLELWLSYIQPWRYVDARGQVRPINGADNVEENERVVSSSRWRPFIEENLPFYSVLFRKMLQRMSRVDLCSFKNANMLHRLTKVFLQANLQKMIQDAESLLQEQQTIGPRLVGGMFSSSSNRGGLLSRSATEVGHAGLVRQHLADLEGPGRAYIPMFSEEVCTVVRQIVSLVQQAKSSLDGQRSSIASSNAPGFFSKFSSIFRMSDVDPYGLTNGGGVPKAEQFLDAALKQLTLLFNISLVQDGQPSTSFKQPSSYTEGSSRVNSIMNGEGNLTPFGRHQVLNRICQPEVSYAGDPDLQPIGSNEIGFLVRLLFQLTSSINEKFAAEITEFYYRQDFVGRFSRQLLRGPTVCRTFQRYGTPSSRDVKFLPPRVSFRPLANKQNLGYIFGLFLLGYINDYGLVIPFIVLVAAVTFYALFGALIEPYRKRPRRNRDQSRGRVTLDSDRRAAQTESLEPTD